MAQGQETNALERLSLQAISERVARDLEERAAKEDKRGRQPETRLPSHTSCSRPTDCSYPQGTAWLFKQQHTPHVRSNDRVRPLHLPWDLAGKE